MLVFNKDYSHSDVHIHHVEVLFVHSHQTYPERYYLLRPQNGTMHFSTFVVLVAPPLRR